MATTFDAGNRAAAAIMQHSAMLPPSAHRQNSDLATAVLLGLLVGFILGAYAMFARLPAPGDVHRPVPHPRSLGAG